jgi:hypothetical protein
MSISTATLNAMQKVGATAFTAAERLKKEVQNYAERVNLAIAKNPYNLGNDALIEGWKVLARLSKTMMGIEEELKNIHRIASELTGDDQPSVSETPALAAPVAKKGKVKAVEAVVTTVKVKKAKAVKPVASAAPVVDVAKIPAKRRVAKKAAEMPDTAEVKAAPAKAAKKVTADKSKATAKVTTKETVKAKKSKAASAPVQAQDLKGNPAKLMTHLQGVLKATDFSDINQSAVAKDAGIPVGSMGATLGRLIKAGRIVSGTNGSLKLAALSAAPSVVQAEPEQVAPVAVESAEQA